MPESAGGQLSVVGRTRLVTGWAVKSSNPGAGEIFSIRQDRLRGPPSPLYKGYRGSFPDVKRPQRGVDHPHPSRAEVVSE